MPNNTPETPIPLSPGSGASLVCLEALQEAYIRLDGELRFSLVNRAAERLLRANRNELIGKTPWEARPDSGGTLLESNLRRAKADNCAISFVNHYEPWSRWYGITAAPDSNGGLIVHFADITDRKTEEVKIQAQLDSFQKIIENTGAGYFRIGMNGCYEDVNLAWLRMHGCGSKDEVIGQHFSAFQVTQDKVEADDIATALMRGEKADGEFSRLRRDGRLGYHTFSANPVMDGQKIVAIEGFLFDVTDRKIAEDESRQSQQRYRALFDSMHEGVAIHTLTYCSGTPANYMLVDVNRRYEEIVGMPRKQVVNKFATDIYATEEAPYLSEYATVVRTGRPTQFQTYFSPMRRHFVISVAHMGGDLFATIFFDVTGQKDTEEALRRSEEKFSRIFQSSPAAKSINDLDDDARVVDVNAAFERITGYKRAEVIGRTVSEIELWVDADERTEAFRLLRSEGHLHNFEHQFRRKSGQIGIGLLSTETVDIADKHYVVSANIDITERKQAEVEKVTLEAQLRQAQKMESIGRLAGGIAHDFNNLLTVINGYAHFLAAKLDRQDPLWAGIEEIRKAGERAAGLTKQLLTFSRKQVVDAKVLDLNAVIRDSERMLQRLIGEDIVLETTLDSQLGKIVADSEQVHQVIMNLVVNARDAMAGGGKLQIATVNIDAPCIPPSHPEAKPGQYVMLGVSDSGCGMDENTRLHMFEPFFTTKGPEIGTGLGLSTVFGIVRQCGGWIDVWSEPGVGTSFKLYFPRTDGSSSDEQPEMRRRQGQHSVMTILVVEDQEPVRLFIKTVLEVHGYTVLGAANSEEALHIARTHSGEIHMLLTDVVLPGMNGRELCERLGAMRPQMKVLFMSGYTGDAVALRGVRDSEAAFIPKPFTPDKLAEMVRDILAAVP